MSIRCQSFLELLEQWAPPHFAEDWDNVGLHAGDRNKEISRIMVALSPGEDAVNAAIEAGVDMLVTHHPLIFRSMKQINSDTATGRSLLKLIRNDVNLYCTHTNMDIAKGGVNDVLAMKEADCSIAMAGGAQAASQVARLVLLDGDFSAMPSIVNEGRRVINNIQRAAALFIVKNIFTVKKHFAVFRFINSRNVFQQSCFSCSKITR